jgi:hypothetical protein
MQTLHEYMMQTKAVEYLIAVVFLLAFIFFWRFAVQRR